jgi:phenylacetate-CoA ligase
MGESKKPVPVLTDSERFPLVRDLSFLDKLRNDPFAPRYNFKSGDRLNEYHLEKLKSYNSTLGPDKKFWKKGETPHWLTGYLIWCQQTVPFYRHRSSDFSDQPTMNRMDIKNAPWDFVSEDCDLNDLMVYKTSGTTAAAIDILFEPFSQASYLPLLQSLLRDYDIELTAKPDSVATALITDQQEAITYASISTYLNGAGVLRMNLNGNEWKDPNHRIRYLEKYTPEVLTGDPFSLLSLLELKPKIKPKAIVSSALRMTHGVRRKLEEYFQCVVLDTYSMTECKMVAVETNGRYKALRPDVYFEIFDEEADVMLPMGERGELVITGGHNSFLPLIRYRTGDFCSLAMEDDIPYLVDLEARNPIAFYDSSDRFINYVNISKTLVVFPLAAFQLHQFSNGSLSFKGWADENLEDEITKALLAIFGKDTLLDIELLSVDNKSSAKPISYSSDKKGILG